MQASHWLAQPLPVTPSSYHKPRGLRGLWWREWGQKGPRPREGYLPNSLRAESTQGPQQLLGSPQAHPHPLGLRGKGRWLGGGGARRQKPVGQTGKQSDRFLWEAGRLLGSQRRPRIPRDLTLLQMWQEQKGPPRPRA